MTGSRWRYVSGRTGVTLYASEGTVRWDVLASSAYAVRSSGGMVTFAATFSNMRVGSDGSVLRMAYSATEVLVPVGEDWFVKTADMLRRVGADGSELDDLATGVDQWVGAIGTGSVSAERGQLVLRDGLWTSSVFLGQLVVAMRAVGETVYVVGERGLVLELDR
jgi:hypothetical protein